MKLMDIIEIISPLTMNSKGMIWILFTCIVGEIQKPLLRHLQNAVMLFVHPLAN